MGKLDYRRRAVLSRIQDILAQFYLRQEVDWKYDIRRILDAILGVMVLLQGRRFGMPLLVFATFSLVMGLTGITVVLSFFNLLLFPIAYIALGVAFLRPDERLEFV